MENKVRIINDGGMYHAYVGNLDFWLNRRELLDLYAAMMPLVKEGGGQ